jgi:hypothetical protein
VWALLLAAPCCGQERLTRWEKVPEYEPMANTPSFWQSSDGALNAAGSWTNGVPGTGIDSIWGDVSHVDASSDMSIAALATLITRPDYKGDIGASGSPVVHATSSARYILRHPGDFYWGGAASTIVTQLVVNKPWQADKVVDLSGTVGRLYVLSGKVQLAAIHTFGGVGGDTWLYVCGNQAEVTITQMDAAETLPDVVRLVAGKLTNARDFSAATQKVFVSGGELIQTGLFKSTMFVHITGGYVRYEPSSDPTAEAPFFLIDGGVLDVRNSQYAIPKSAIEIGLGGTLLGNAIDKTGSYYDLDLNEEYP